VSHYVEMPRPQAKNAKKGLRPFLPWEAFRALFLPLFVACSSLCSTIW
jgi:hypothetical protein